MRRGLPFWLLRLESARCPKCKRDNIWRPVDYPRLVTLAPLLPRFLRWTLGGRGMPQRCRWCESSMVDWVRMTRLVNDLGAAFGSFNVAVRAATTAMNAFTWHPTVWTVDVETATHDDLREGETVTRISRVQVLAPDETEAKLVACQMAATGGRMPTKATVVTPEALEWEHKTEEARRAGPGYRLDNPLSHAVRVRRLEP